MAVIVRSHRTRLVAGLLLACFSLLPAGRVVADCGDSIPEVDEGCDDGNHFGGDGCASNCTSETVRDFTLDPIGSKAVTQLKTFSIDLPLAGEIRFTSGKALSDGDGTIPLVVRAADLRFDPIRVPSLACVCVQAREFPNEYNLGPGNVAAGVLGCGAEGLPFGDLVVEQDHNIGIVGSCDGAGIVPCEADTDCPESSCFTEEQCSLRNGVVETEPNPGVCNGPTEGGFVQQASPRGSMQVLDRIGFVLLFDGGSCCSAGTDPGCEDAAGLKGPDGIPCTDDDPNPGEPHDVPVVTGTAKTTIRDVDNVPGAILGDGLDCGSAPCVAKVTGTPFDCDRIERYPNGGLEGGRLVSAFPLLNNGGFGDSLVTLDLRTFPAAPDCAGDCDANGQVTVDELVRGVGIALGSTMLSMCSVIDSDQNGRVEINELVRAVNNALSGCS